MSAFIQAQSCSYMDDLTYSKRDGLNLFEGYWKISLTGALIMVFERHPKLFNEKTMSCLYGIFDHNKHIILHEIFDHFFES